MAIGFGGTYLFIKGANTKEDFINSYNSRNGILELNIATGFFVTIVVYIGLNLIAQ